MITIDGKQYQTDNDLHVDVLGFSPRAEIRDSGLRAYFKNTFGREFLGADELIAYSQALVSKGIDFAGLEATIASDINAGKDIEQTVFDKTATGIGRGHSLGGLPNITLGISGTKMIDSGLTGFCMSRSLVTSLRRRAVTEEEIAVPEALAEHPELLKEYLQVSKDVFAVAEMFKQQAGKMGGVESFNKVLPYNNPSNLLWEVPLDTLASLAFEVKKDKRGVRQYLPRELHILAERLPALTDEAGMGIMFRQRSQVPRNGYLHYNVFKNPQDPNFAHEKGSLEQTILQPRIVEIRIDATPGFNKYALNLKQMKDEVMKEKDPARLHEKAMAYTSEMNRFVNEYNDSLRIQISDSLSWRVWSEQKRHATLRQNVEAVESAAHRALDIFAPIFSSINAIIADEKESSKYTMLPLDKIEKALVIDERVKKNPQLAREYVYHTGKQLMLYGKMLNQGVEPRAALFAVPRNIRLKTLETYDLTQLLDLELPLRLCSTCEPERQNTSWKKREMIGEVLKDMNLGCLNDLITPKCGVGYCTEGKPCQRIYAMREYSPELHASVKAYILERSK